MKNLFQRASSAWVRYSGYEYKKAGNGHFYITPVAGAKPQIYDPLKDAEQMVLDALNIGALQMNRKSGSEVRDAVMEFVGRYGLLGFLTACISGLHPHCLRHTFATRGAEKQVDIWVMQRFLGHANIQKTASTYTHVLGDLKRDEMQKLANVVNY